MLPFGAIRMLKALKGKNDTLEMFFVAVDPEGVGFDDVGPRIQIGGVEGSDLFGMGEVPQLGRGARRETHGLQHRAGAAVKIKAFVDGHLIISERLLRMASATSGLFME